MNKMIGRWLFSRPHFLMFSLLMGISAEVTAQTEPKTLSPILHEKIQFNVAEVQSPFRISKTHKLPVSIRYQDIELATPARREFKRLPLYAAQKLPPQMLPAELKNNPQLFPQNRFIPDRNTQKEGQLSYHTVFNPSIVPYKRNSALNCILPDYTLGNCSKLIHRLKIIGLQTRPNREVFWGSLNVAVSPNRFTPIPSVSPSSDILSYETAPPVRLEFYVDEAGNYYLKGLDKTDQVVQLTFLTDAPTNYFGSHLKEEIDYAYIPDQVKYAPPPWVQKKAQIVVSSLRIQKTDSFVAALTKLVAYFRAFVPGDIPKRGNDVYLDLALNQKGVCRHRSFAFMVTANSLGIPTRFVSNEAHAFVEVFIPARYAPYWLRIDLGGAAAGLSITNGENKALHRPKIQSRFKEPKSFKDWYSHDLLYNKKLRKQFNPNITGLPKLQKDKALAKKTRPESKDGPETSSHKEPKKTIRKGFYAQVRLTHLTKAVFRGENIEIQGVIKNLDEAQNPQSLENITIEIGIASKKEEKAVPLGTLLTDAKGDFKGKIKTPRDIPPGRYWIKARILGRDQLLDETDLR